MCYVNNVLDIERTAFEKPVAVLVLEICLSEKALMKVQVDLEIEDSGGKTTLLNTKEAAILYNFIEWYGWYFQYYTNPQCFCL